VNASQTEASGVPSGSRLEDEASLFRFVDDDEALDNTTSGKLWLRTFAHFVKLEDPQRQDAREGAASGQIRGGNWINWINEQNMVSPQYILSFTECESPPREWGRHRLKLASREEFSRRIKESMPRCTVIFGKVEYSDDTDYRRRPTGLEMWQRASLVKPTCYCAEKEWRVILVLNQLRIINRTLKIDVGVLSGVLDYYPQR
jgi:hypothetical protein